MLLEKNECCPFFDPEKWDKKTFNWDGKLFIRETLPTFFHIPFPPLIGKKILTMCNLSDNANANPVDKTDMLVLFHDPSPFKSEIYYSVTTAVEGADNTSLSGTFVAGVFDGPYNSIPKFMKVMDDYLAQENQKAKDYYVHYAYCPGCAKKYNHNYMILFAEIIT